MASSTAVRAASKDALVTLSIVPIANADRIPDSTRKMKIPLIADPLTGLAILSLGGWADID